MLNLREELKAAGDELLSTPSSSVNKLLECLKKLDGLLSDMSQQGKTDALLPAMKALISSNILRHSEEEVKILVTSCITQITRITAPDPPFNDDDMKEIFQLIVTAFGKLSDESDRCYDKAVSILDNFSLVRSSVVMLDLECDDLVIQMFQHFLRIIRMNHSDEIFRNVKKVMITVLEESEDVSLDLLGPLLDILVKGNQAVSPKSWALAEQVFAECSDKLKPYVHQAVQSRGRNIDEFAEIVAFICHGGAGTIQPENSNAYRREVDSEDEEKPKSAVNIEAENAEKGRTFSLTNVKKRRRCSATLSKSSLSKELIIESSTKSSNRLAEFPRTRLRRKCTSAWDEDPLVGRRIEVWWPMDKKFYAGVVGSFDRQKKKHSISYDDGEVEVLNMEKQRWNLIDDDVSPDAEQGTDVEKLEVASDTKGKSESEPAKGRKATLRPRRSDDGRNSAGRSKSAEGANENQKKRTVVLAMSSKVKKSGDKSAPKEPVVADESVDAPSRTRTNRGTTKGRSKRFKPKTPNRRNIESFDL